MVVYCNIIISIVVPEEEGVHKPSMYFVLVEVILKHFLCIKHGNLVFPRGYSTDATLLASYWSDPGNQVGTYTSTQFGTNGTTCLLRHHTFILHTPLFIPCSWYTYSKGFI